MTVCYLGLGSNIDCPHRHLIRAIKEIKQLPKTIVIKMSSIYKTKPIGWGYQPGYCNQVVMIKTQLLPTQLLTYCQNLEKKHHRVKKRIWGPRTLDIDILLFGSKQYDLAHLKIPHPELLNREFVLKPLFEINPDIKWYNSRFIRDFIS